MWQNMDPVSSQESKDLNNDATSDKQLCIKTYNENSCAKEIRKEFIKDYLLQEPHLMKSHTCTIMFLYNLAQPQWNHISCREKLIGDVFCSIKQNLRTINVSIQNKIDFSICQKGFLKKKKKCFELIWHTFSSGFRNRRMLSLQTFNSLLSFVINIIKNNVNLPFYSHHLRNIIIVKKQSVPFCCVKRHCRGGPELFFSFTYFKRIFYSKIFVFMQKGYLYDISLYL